MSDRPILKVIEALQSVTGFTPKRNGQGWIARCPAHDDKRPSLSIGVGDDGCALLKCHAGCATNAVVTALSLRLADLMPDRPSPSPKPRPKSSDAGFSDGDHRKVFTTAAEAVAALEAQHGKRAALWTYHDVNGEPVGVVVRWDRPDGEKDIRPVCRRGDGWIIGAMPDPRPLYRLCELKDANRVYIVEGEKCAEALRSVGLLVTTSAGGSQAANKTNWEPCARKECLILPDNDKPGVKYADDVCDLLAKLTPKPSVKIVALPGLSDSGDVFDFIEARRADGRNDGEIRAEIEALAEAAEKIETEPSRPAILSWRPFPIEALPRRLRTFVAAVAAATGTDAAYAALAVLVVIAGCIGNRAAVIVKSGWVEPAVLWGVLVGRSGTTKSPVLKAVIRALVELYKAERHAFAEAMQRYFVEVEHHAVRMLEWKKTQRDGPPTDPPAEPEAPREKRVLVSDITVEKLGCLLEENPLGLLLVRDELAAWVGMFDRYAAGGKGSDQPAWMSMNDAASVVIDRKTGKGNIFVERAAVSVLGSIQPGTLRRIFGAAEREAGLLARVILAYPPNRPTLWTEAALPDSVSEEWRDLLSSLLALPPGEDESGDPRPRLIPIGQDAKTLWINWHNKHARELVEIQDDDLAAHHAKLKGVCARIALLFCCVEVASAGSRAGSIGAESMHSAIVITEWFKYEARRVYSMLGESDEERERRKLIDLIHRKGGTVTVREWQRIRSHKKAADTERELDGLALVGIGRWQVEPQTGRGHPTKRFVLGERSDSSDTDTNTTGDPENGNCVSVGSVSEGESGTSEASGNKQVDLARDDADRAAIARSREQGP